MSNPTPRPDLTSLPPEILHLIAQHYIADLPHTTAAENNVTSVLTTCTLFRDLFLPKLYSSICIYTLDQLSRFTSPTSGSHRYCPIYTLDNITINIPGVPGGGDGTSIFGNAKGACRSRDRLLLASKALALCPKAEQVSLEFFSVRHSEILTTDEFRHTEAKAFEDAVKRLERVKRFRWVPPRCDANAIMGLSIVIVDQIIPSLAKGLVGCQNLETLELWNTMLPLTGGADLAQSLIHISSSRSHLHPHPCPLNLNLRSVTGLDPKTVSDLALASPPIRVNIADGFSGSIWGARIDKNAVEECMRDTLDPSGSSRNRSNESSPSSSKASSIATSRATTPELLIQDTLAKVSEMVNIRVLQGGIAGSRILAH